MRSDPAARWNRECDEGKMVEVRDSSWIRSFTFGGSGKRRAAGCSFIYKLY